VGSLPVDPNTSYEVQKVAGNYSGTLSNWAVDRLSKGTEKQHRDTVNARAEDLVSNDAHATSVIDSMTVNTIGTGIVPVSTPNAKMLGWNDQQVQDFQEQAEWSFNIWCEEADAGGRYPFWGIQSLSVHSMLTIGEYLRVPVMMDDSDRTFSFALQCVDAKRIYTPNDKTDQSNIREGIEFGKYGETTHIWVANPDNNFIQYDMDSSRFSRLPAKIAHRPGVFHGFVPKTEEQVRGRSILEPAMKFFRDISDYLDFELVGAIIASSFPVFIENTNPIDAINGMKQMNQNNPADNTKYQNVNPGQVLYGNASEKPHILKSDRPGASFGEFVERILRGVGASVGMPYEVITKDFSKTNYSSARAALLEAHRVFSVYRKWLISKFCKPCWDMVIEEAWLRNYIKLPSGSPDFYKFRHAYTAALWIPPKRGNVDPLKEMKAKEIAKKLNIETLQDMTAESGGKNWKVQADQIARENKYLSEVLNLTIDEDKEEDNSNEGEK
jgi:lambda family phage portal protein